VAKKTIIINDVCQILRGVMLVVTATKFETKSAITRFEHVYYEIL